MWSPEVAPASQPLAAHAMTGPSGPLPYMHMDDFATEHENCGHSTRAIQLTR
jgi:predicted component of type VI protein secretion system